MNPESALQAVLLMCALVIPATLLMYLYAKHQEKKRKK